MKAWIEPQPVDVPQDLEQIVGGHPLVARILVRRGLFDPRAALAFLDPDQYVPAHPSDLPDLDLAVDRLEQAVDRGEHICVWGDFDVDGQTATTLLVSALRSLGAQVSFHIPVRATESHGVTLEVLQQLLPKGIDLLLTCDTGVASHEAIDLARTHGVDVVVTDHHDLPPTLPRALAVVNPKRLPGGHPLETLPGVGVAYKVVESLFYRSGLAGMGSQYLDLVALGIVADVALQTGDTRYLLQRGLDVLRQTKRQGLLAMMALADLHPERLTEEHIGFVLGPRLNALGRLADANWVVEFLTTDDPVRARVLATELEGLNAKRRLLTNQVFEGAMAQIERNPTLLDDAALVLAHPSWPAGVIGIVASRLVERFNRPVVLIASPPGQLARGSARSVNGCNITAAISAHADVLARFGGHPMAAGFAIAPEQIPLFRRRLARTVREMLGDVPAVAALAIDGYLSLAELTPRLVADLERLAPFGPGNPPLILASRDMSLRRSAPLGREGEHLLMVVEDNQGASRRVVWWQGAGWGLPAGRFDLAYTAHATTYRGQPEIEVVWQDARPAEQPVESERPQPIEIVDWRREPDQGLRLATLRRREEVVVWCEGSVPAEIGGSDRYELQPAQVLVVWTTPPGRGELQAVMQSVSPYRVYLVGVDPGTDGMEPFLQRLAGLVKYALNRHNGRLSLRSLAAATAQREETAWLGLQWLAGRGHVRVVDHQEDLQVLAAGEGIGDEEAGRRITAQLQAALAETAAYRAHFRQADAAMLLAAPFDRGSSLANGQ